MVQPSQAASASPLQAALAIERPRWFYSDATSRNLCSASKWGQTYTVPTLCWSPPTRRAV